MKKLFCAFFAVTVFTLFFVPVEPLQAESTDYIYNDNIWVDLKIGDGGAGKKYELYRDAVFVNFWQNEPAAGVYYSDLPGAAGEYEYQVKYYTWNEGETKWDYTGASVVIEVDTTYVDGRLHNSTEWQNKLGRGPISWISGSLYRVLDVEIYDGTLEIDGADVLFNNLGSGGSIAIRAGSGLHADGATFSAGTFAGTVNFYNQSGPQNPLIENSTLEHMEVSFMDCTGVEISDNILVNNSIIHLSSGGEYRILNNQGSGTIELYSQNSRVEGNQVDFINVFGGSSNLIQGNNCPEISVQASGNQIIENTLEGVLYDEGISLDNCHDNTIQGNTITTGYISVWNSDTNLIKQNRINQSQTSGILINYSSFNSVEDNNIYQSRLEGILVANDSHSNVIAFNHIYGGGDPLFLPVGISIGGGDGNGVHENIAEDYYFGVEIGAAASNSWVYNNLFRDNQRNAVDDGINTTWNKPKTSLAPGHNIVGGPYLGGNYWSDYTGTDGDGDKLGDKPYFIENESGFAAATDSLPLIWVSMPSPTPGPTPETIIIGSGDYNGDGTSDIAVFRGSSGLWAVRGVTRVYFGVSADIPVSGDYDGDGTTDVGIFRGSTGLWAVRGVTRSYFGSSDDIPVPLRFKPSSACSIGIFRESSGLWALRGVTRVYFGASGDVPVPGDYDGDGTEDLGVFRPATGLWALRGISRVYFGSSSDATVPGDYSGDGTWEEGIFRSSSGLWAIRDVTRVYFGSSSDDPVPADYNGSGEDDIGIFRDTSGLWAIRGVSRAYYGASGDIPVTR